MPRSLDRVSGLDSVFLLSDSVTTVGYFTGAEHLGPLRVRAFVRMP